MLGERRGGVSPAGSWERGGILGGSGSTETEEGCWERGGMPGGSKSAGREAG